MRTLLWKELLEQWRSYRLLVVSAVLAAFGIVGPLSAKYLPVLLANVGGIPQGFLELMPKPDVAMAFGEYLDDIIQFGVVLAILVPMASVVGEKASGTIEISLSKPVSRAAFLLAKFLAHTVTFVLGILLAGLAGYYYTGLLFEWLPPARFFAVNALVLLYLLVFVAITILSSTVARSQLVAAGMAFGTLILFGILSALPSLAKYLPGALVGWARALGAAGPGEPVWGAVGVSLGMIAMALASAGLILRRQEL